MSYKKALVVGGGIAGIEAALDLAEMEIETYLVDRAPSIGGRMVQLDKTFPTNDCAMCILSPKLVEVGNHPYVHIISNAEIMTVTGDVPPYTVKINKLPRYINEEICTGCGVCTSQCPVKIPDPYNMGLSYKKCISIPFPQAIPALPLIDRDACRFFTTGKCRVCEKVCEMKAVDFEQQNRVIEVEVGSIIIACGSSEFNARKKGELGYGMYPNVLTSPEFERILSASGPTGGHIKRPSDGKEPGRIGIIQCVGSRDLGAGNDHCSAICCMQTAKDAIIIKEHLPDANTTVFYMDIRAYGKDFDKFIERAKDEYKTRFIRARIGSVAADPLTDNLIVSYANSDGGVHKEEFDLLVVSVGLEPSRMAREMTKQADIRVDARGFIKAGTFTPISTNRPGIFMCGSVAGPKDIPESVIEASGAASAVAAFQKHNEARKLKAIFPAETDIRGQAPAVGVFICRCGINIASVIDVPKVVAYASTLPRVKHAQEFLFSCSQDSQNAIGNAIRDKHLNRIVVAACTPRTHEVLFQKTLSETGINPYMFEFANIREQCSWVHQKEPGMATEKAFDLVRMAVARVILAQPLKKKKLNVNKGALVIGGGLAGMTAAFDLASQGYSVNIIEKEKELGGNALHVKRSLYGESTAPLLEKIIQDTSAHPGIQVHLNTEVKTIEGYVGNFSTTLSNGGAKIEHGVVIIASGGRENTPHEYFYGENKKVITQRELEERLEVFGLAGTIVMIQCVGSRVEGRQYCSRVCCSQAVKNAIRIRELAPKAKIYILFRDMRTYGLKERYYRLAREKKITFLRFAKDEKPVVTAKNSDLAVSVKDITLNRRLVIKPDLLVLSAGIIPNPENKILSRMLKVPLNQDGFFLEAHMKLKPVDFATDGVYVCGLAHYPRDISETIAQGRAAAGRAATILSKDTIEGEGKVSYIREDLCNGCKACVRTCPYNALSFDETRKIAVANEALCKGCGICSAMCRPGAIDLMGFKNEQILASLGALTTNGATAEGRNTMKRGVL